MLLRQSSMFVGLGDVCGMLPGCKMPCLEVIYVSLKNS
jgi:hypothetical protein